MAEVALSGEELMADIREAPPADGPGFFGWLGEHSFVVKAGGLTLYVDPYLSPDPGRQTPPLLAPEHVINADLVLCTHDHGDHIDPYALAGIAGASRHALFVAPRPHRQRMLDIGISGLRLWL